MVLKNLFAFGEFDYEIKYSIKKKNCYKKIEKTSMVYKNEKVNNYQTTLKQSNKFLLKLGFNPFIM